jgi:hypothetical protein
MAQFGLAAVEHLARMVAGALPEREQIPAQREEKVEHWRSARGQRILPGAEPQRMEESTSVNSGELPDMRKVVQSLQAPSNLRNCNDHPLQFSQSQIEIGPRLDYVAHSHSFRCGLRFVVPPGLTLLVQYDEFRVGARFRLL